MTTTHSADANAGHAAARAQYIANRVDGETVEDALFRRITAAYEMYLIETGRASGDASTLAEALGLASRNRPLDLDASACRRSA